MSRVPDNVDEAIIINYIKQKSHLTNDDDLSVKHIPTRAERSRPNCKCFQVGIRFDMMEMVYNQNFWPKNVAFERFKFRRTLEISNPSHDDKSAFLGK